MSIWVKIKVTDDMKEHVRSYSDIFYKEVVEKACLSPKDVSLLIHMMRYKTKKTWYDIRNGTSTIFGSYSALQKALSKLIALGLVTKLVSPKRRVETLYFYEEAKKNSSV